MFFFTDWLLDFYFETKGLFNRNKSYEELTQRIKNVILLKLCKIPRNYIVLLILLFTDIMLDGIKNYLKKNICHSWEVPRYLHIACIQYFFINSDKAFDVKF